ncbi:hypothetical protein VTO73DRAFT_12935 [Trametes versicolor]
MENCPFPIELCEAVIDGTIPWPTHIRRYSPPLAQLTVQRTLYACALTCRAWRTRAQRLLWSYVYLKNAPTAISFASASRIASGECRSLLSTLCIGEELRGTLIDEKHLAVTDLANVNELFMLPFPNLFTLHCTAVRFNLGPGVLRMRLPFFSTGSLNTLVLRLCIFDSARAFLDLVWAFPNLSHLHVVYGKLRREILTPVGAAHLASVGNQLQAGRRLTSVNFHHLNRLFGGSIGIMLTRSVFGPTLTHLILTFYDLDDAQCTSTLLAGEPSSFPSLILLNVKLTHRCSDSFGFGMGRIQSVLELVISSSTGSPSKLERSLWGAQRKSLAKRNGCESVFPISAN